MARTDPPHHLIAPAGVCLASFGQGFTAAVVGATGGIGSAFVAALQRTETVAGVFALSRAEFRPVGGGTVWLPMDITDEASVRAAAEAVRRHGTHLGLVIVASGILHDDQGVQPEKSWRSLDPVSLERAFRVNAIGPALVAKHFLPVLARDRKSAFAALSARVGSISDNRLGGWHGYRASKAALNMLVRTLSIELKRVNPQGLCVALHPGTVDTGLSRPFQANVPPGTLFTPAFAATRMLAVLDGLTPDDSGHLYAWDGARIPF